MGANDGKSEIDVNIQGHDIPYVTWVFIGVALLLIGAGIGASFFLRGGISLEAQIAQDEMAIRQYAESLELQTSPEEAEHAGP
jgi:hypothetical protein